MAKGAGNYLSKREQQIMELAYEHGRLTTSLVTAHLPGSPASSTVRTLLKILEEKGHLRHIEEDGKYVYLPVRPHQSAARHALAKVVQTFFKGSVSDVVATLLTESDTKLTDQEIVRLQELIRQSRESEK
jgi:predicted transcriptional regulator